MKTDIDSRPQAPSAFNGIARQLSEATKQELAAFRDSLRRQISAFEDALLHTDQAELIDRVVGDLAKAAIDQTEAAVCQTRSEAAEQTEQQIRMIQDRAAIELETMRIEWQTRLDRSEAASAERANALADSLEVARQEVTTLKSELEACGRDLLVAGERLRALEEVRTMLEAQAEQDAVANQRRAEALALAPLARLQSALEKFGATASARGLLEALIEHLAIEFARAALFAAGSDHFKVWMVRGVDEPTDGVAVPFDVDSPLRHALTNQRPATFEPDAGTRAVGPFGSPVGSAIALPVVANGRTIAVAYAENSPEHPRPATDVGFKIADILVSHVNRRFAGKRSEPAKASASNEDPLPTTAETEHRQFSPARRVSRVKMQAGTEVVVDGATSVLVDLSTAGAQILCPSTVRPNHSVSMLLPRKEGLVTCKGRVVWAFLEESQGSGGARYRAGVTFTETDIAAVEAFLIQYGTLDAVERATAKQH